VEKPKRPSDGKQAFRFLCAQSADKLHPAHDTLFARILMTVPSAQLDVLCNMQARSVVDALAARMRREFSRHGVDFDARCRVHAQLPTADYFRFLDAADACLDSLDFSGGLTSLDALWHNLPVVTLPGQLMRGRQTYGMLKLLDIDELIATDTDSYVAIAAKLANDDAFYSRVADAIHARKMQLYADSGVVEALRAFLVNVEVPT
jgi:predicted O-linked N-acetylglucosamine transferase (SPINDLY family)